MHRTRNAPLPHHPSWSFAPLCLPPCRQFPTATAAASRRPPHCRGCCLSFSNGSQRRCVECALTKARHRSQLPLPSCETTPPSRAPPRLLFSASCPHSPRPHTHSSGTRPHSARNCRGISPAEGGRQRQRQAAAQPGERVTLFPQALFVLTLLPPQHSLLTLAALFSSPGFSQAGALGCRQPARPACALPAVSLRRCHRPEARPARVPASSLSSNSWI